MTDYLGAALEIIEDDPWIGDYSGHGIALEATLTEHLGECYCKTSIDL